MDGIRRQKPFGRLRIGYARILGTQRGTYRRPGARLRATGQKVRDVTYQGAKRLDAASSGEDAMDDQYTLFIFWNCRKITVAISVGKSLETQGKRL